jgi:hypothetical protein
VFYELESSAYRAYPNMDAAKETLLNLINMNSIERDELRRSIRNKTVRHYSWEASINTWIEAIDSLNVDNKRPWSDKQRFIIPQVVDLDYSLSAFDLSKYICNNIIHSDSLLYSEFCQKAIRDLDLGVSKSSNGFSTFTKEMLVKNLEQYANHKVFIDDIRLSNNAIMEDFIDYARS